MKDEKLICKICGYEGHNYTGFGIHITKGHKIKVKDYYDKFFKKANEGICTLEGCNNETTFYSFKKGYAECCSSKCSNNLPWRLEFRSNQSKEMWKDEEYHLDLTKIMN